MDDNALIVTPSLAQHFAQERRDLQTALNRDLSPAQVVGEARRALDRAGLSFTRSVTDPQIQKAGLWLLEIIKSGAGVLDRATHAEVDMIETAPRASRFDGLKGWRPSLFYMAAASFAVIGLVQGTALLVVGAATLGILHGVSSLKSGFMPRLPFAKTPQALPAPDGRTLTPHAVIRTDIAGFINQLTESLATADHILARMVQTDPTDHWRDDPNLLAMFQNLLEAREAGDGNYALQVVGKEMKTVLSAAGLEALDYSKTTAQWFDELPALIINEGDPDIEMAAPALMTKDGRLIRRGTVWVRRR
jgi:hypothetical protein